MTSHVTLPDLHPAVETEAGCRSPSSLAQAFLCLLQEDSGLRVHHRALGMAKPACSGCDECDGSGGAGEMQV